MLNQENVKVGCKLSNGKIIAKVIYVGEDGICLDNGYAMSWNVANHCIHNTWKIVG